MGRELQKKKNKSSLPKKRQNGPSKKKVLSNPIIAKHWNQKETLSQNYRRLGLTSRLNHATGGTEKTIKLLGLNDPKSSRADVAADSTANRLNIVSKQPMQATEIEEIEVERDPETGAILRVTGQKEEKYNPLNDPLNELEESDDEVEWNGFAMVPERRENEAQNPVISELEEAARNGARKAPRKQSDREAEWLERLANKYGEDYGRMARDRKLNPMQQTEADIKKRMKKWKATQDA
ncbi:ribosome biogenesis protein Nop16 [Stagonosporopsis vannaccii]|nr:ribosome biogenesis protein Nop16 [Stagonosporopsis vannaccii]